MASRKALSLLGASARDVSTAYAEKPKHEAILLGDSWVNAADGTATWPVCLVRPRRILNLAQPRSGCNDIGYQLGRLAAKLEYGEQISAEAVVVIHTCGNDLFHSPLAQLLGVFRDGLFPRIPSIAVAVIFVAIALRWIPAFGVAVANARLTWLWPLGLLALAGWLAARRRSTLLRMMRRNMLDACVTLHGFGGVLVDVRNVPIRAINAQRVHPPRQVCVASCSPACRSRRACPSSCSRSTRSHSSRSSRVPSCTRCAAQQWRSPTVRS